MVNEIKNWFFEKINKIVKFQSQQECEVQPTLKTPLTNLKFTVILTLFPYTTLFRSPQCIPWALQLTHCPKSA